MANISDRNTYQPNIHAPNANPPPIWMVYHVSMYIKVLVKELSHNLIIRVGRKVTASSIEVTSGDEGKGALETDEYQHEDNVDADGADEHDEIEDCHE
jgi:hypothetical protein